MEIQTEPVVKIEKLPVLKTEKVKIKELGLDFEKVCQELVRLNQNPMYACSYYDTCGVNKCFLDTSLGKKMISSEDLDRICMLKKKHRKVYIKKLQKRFLGISQKNNEQNIQELSISELKNR